MFKTVIFMLQLWLRCWLTSGIMLCGWAGMFWVDISGITFRSSLGGLLCRLQLLWGELSFFISCSLYDFSAVLVSRILVAVGCCCFFVYGLVLRFVLISAISILWWWFSGLKCLKLMFIFVEQCEVLCVFFGFNLRSWRFFQRFALVFSKFPWGWRLRSGWVISSCVEVVFVIFLGSFDIWVVYIIW